MQGPDHDLIKQVSNSCNVPLIYSSGVGNYDHIKDIFQMANISAVACGSLFNFTDSNPIRTKSYLKSYNIEKSAIISEEKKRGKKEKSREK